MRKYYYSNGVDRKGPVSLVELITSGELTSETLVWYEGLPSWTRADALPELRDVVSPEPSAESESGSNSTAIAVALTIGVLILIGTFAYFKWVPRESAWEKHQREKMLKETYTKSRRLTTSELAREVEESVSKHYGDGTIVDDLTLIHKGGNEYVGLMRARYYGNGRYPIDEYKLSIEVIYDGNSFQWSSRRVSGY